jgi:ATP-grasp domain, R2K clade family 3
MPVTWVLESNVFSERCFDEMVDHLRAHNFPFHIVRIVPFSHELVGATPIINGPCVVYGSLGVQKLAAAHGWKPGVWTSDAFSSRTYSARLGELFLNHELLACRFSDVPTKVLALGWETFFIKPDSDGKAFAGTIIDPAEIDLWVENLRSSGLLAENDFDVVLAKPQALGREWRTVVVGGKVAAFSLYKQYQRVWTERSIDPEARATVERAAKLFAPADVYVADVCETSDGMKIIEYNTFNSAGLYACDTSAVIEEVSALVEGHQ